MRQNTYFVVYCVESTPERVAHHHHMTTMLLVDDPSAITKDIYNKALEHYEKIGVRRHSGFYVESISLIDSFKVKTGTPGESGIRFSGDKDLLIEGRKYLVRYDGHETHYCIGIYRDGILMEVDSEIEIRWGSTKPLLWAGPLQ